MIRFRPLPAMSVLSLIALQKSLGRLIQYRAPPAINPAIVRNLLR